MNRETVLARRLERQGFSRPARSEREYLELVKRLQPVAPVHFSMPGSPPRLVHRTSFDDGVLADRLRGQVRLVKGRFWSGNIGYVLAEDFELYAAAFCRPLERFNAVQEQVYQTLRSTGPLTPRQLREETGLRHRQLMAGLHRLQQAFAVYEAQEDSSWERPWSLLEAEWPEMDLGRWSWEEAAARVLGRFLEGHVFATFQHLRDWSQFPMKKLRGLLAKMEEAGQVAPCQVEGLGQGWTVPQTARLEPRGVPQGVYMVHKADCLVKSHLTELRERFGGREVLQYLLIDGEFAGAACGHWRIGPHDVEDIVVKLAREEAQKRRSEIVAEVGRGYYPPRSRIRRFNGKSL